MRLAALHGLQEQHKPSDVQSSASSDTFRLDNKSKASSVVNMVTSTEPYGILGGRVSSVVAGVDIYSFFSFFLFLFISRVLQGCADIFSCRVQVPSIAESV